MARRIHLYTKLGQITDYLLPVLVLYIALTSDVGVVGQVLLILLAVIFLVLSLKSYRVSIEGQYLYLNNLFLNKKISIADITSIERKPFYYSSSGGIAAYSYQLHYTQNEVTKSVIVVIGKGEQYQKAWEALKRSVRVRA